MTTAYTLNQAPDADELMLYADNTEPLYKRKLDIIRGMIESPGSRCIKNWIAFFWLADMHYQRELTAQRATTEAINTAAHTYAAQAMEEIAAGEYDWL